MAKIVVYSMAYRGDVHPYVPVATELANRGHKVTFVVPQEFHAEFAAEPFECVHSGSDFGPIELNEWGDWIAKWGMRFGGAGLLRLYFGRFTVPHLEATYSALHDALDGADVLFCHSTAGIVGAMAAEAHGIPWISGDLFPMLIPTETASPLPTVTSMGPTLNRAGWRLARATRPDALSYAGAFAEFRRSKGLDDRRRGPIDLRISPFLNLGMASRHYISPASDWPDNYHLTGFTHWQNAAGSMPDGLDEFLDAGDPPVLITLGTLAASAHPERFADAVAAADSLGRRTVSLCSLDSTVDRLRFRFSSDRHRAWPYAPLPKVLDRVSAVVHSGSHGTNSMVLAAGLPSVAIPSIFDQVWHGRRQEQLGTGVYARKSKDLAAALEKILTEPQFAANAHRICDLLAAEDGTAMTADRIENFVASLT